MSTQLRSPIYTILYIYSEMNYELTAAGVVLLLDTISDGEEAVPAMLFFTTLTETISSKASKGEESELKNKLINPL